MDQQELQEQLLADKKIAELEEQYREAVAAESFFDTASGKIATQIATLEIDKLIKEIASDKFLKDHTGYVNAVSMLSARRDWLRRLQLAGSPRRKTLIETRLEETKDGVE